MDNLPLHSNPYHDPQTLPSQDVYRTAAASRTRPSMPLPPLVGAQQPVNGPTRAISDSRYSSGASRKSAIQNKHQSAYPTAPEVSLDYPTSYLPQQSHEDGHSYPLTGSFAQRAAALTGRSKLPPNPNHPAPDTALIPTNQKSERRQSLNRPIGGLYSEIQQHRRDSWPAGKSPTSPRRTSFPQSPQETYEKPSSRPILREQVAEPHVESDRFTAERAPVPRPIAKMSSQLGNDKWASDRSPLQKLEAKLSDISKEEKRARVEQAEQRLRDSRAAAQEKALRKLESREPDSSRTGPTAGNQPRPAGPREPRRPDAIEPRSTSMRNARPRSLERISHGPSRGSAKELAHKDEVGTESRPSRRNIEILDDEVTESDTGIPRHTLRNSGSAAPSGVPQSQQVNSGRKRQVPVEQRRLYETSVQPSARSGAASGHLDQPGGNQPHAGANNRKGHDYRSPPETTAGIHARQQVGFDNEEQRGAKAMEQPKHHLQFPHLRQDRPLEPPAGTQPRAALLDEWKQGGVARLETEDFEDGQTGDAPWWEKKETPKSRRRSRRGSIGTVDPYPEGNGEYSGRLSSLSDASIRSMPPIVTRSYRVDDRARRISKKEVLSVIRKDDQRRSLRSLLRPAGLVSEYSYSCPSLAEHDHLHPSHVCEPFLDKELTMSMRSVRIRAVPISTSFSPPLYLKCGPLLRYTGMKRDRLIDDNDATKTNERETWRGSVMIVTNDADSRYEPGPVLRLFPEPMEKIPPPEPSKVEERDSEDLPHHYLDPIAGLPKLSRTGKTLYVKPVDDLEHAKDLSKFETDDDGLFEEVRSAAVPTAYGTPEYRHGQAGPTKSRPKRGHRVKGIRLYTERGVTFWRFNLEVVLQAQETRIAYSINNGPAVGFWVPAIGQTMNIMFHSCNGFSLSIDPNEYSGPDPLWRDVLNSHQTKPFHVMIGGGDQIYNDAVMKQSPLFGDWLDIKNPVHKRDARFTHEIQEELETFYLERYSMWFSQGLFGMANSQIPMINMWDDHDIIDGFGSYPDHFMSTPVFCGLGAIAFKYYMLFQHQSVPAETSADEPSWLLGAGPGPYISELSRSVFMSLGKHVSFLGLDCRTERTREEILSEASYGGIFDRCRREIIKGETKHLVVLLGVPIAYPRLVWLENLLTSRALDPIKAMGRMGILGNFLNKFDGGVEILDDLDDHWTAKNHKQERNWFIEELQELAAEMSIRITILSGDVHLAAVGQFLSNPKLKIPKDRDHRYMPNIISSAIVNAPPANMMSDILNKRNKTHHLDRETNENMIPMFSHESDGKSRNNKRLLPRRNWCSIREYQLGSSPPPTPPESDYGSEAPSDHEEEPKRIKPQRTLSLTRNDMKPRQLIRRLSGRAPKSYLASIDYATPSPPMTPKDNQQSSRRAQLQRSSSTPQQDDDESPQPPPSRPTFLRRPTDLKERDLKNVGREHTQGHVNLEHGLDICLHSEINQKDPSGATFGYRLLVPALFYEGEGDENSTVLRRPTILQRLNSMRVRGPKKDIDPQDQGSLSSRNDNTISEASSTEIDHPSPVRPRRWSFGLEKRRRYRDQTPPPRNDQAVKSASPRRDPVEEARAMGEFRDRSYASQNHQSPPQSAGSDRRNELSTIRNPQSSSRPAQQRQVADVQNYDGYESSDNDSIVHNTLDSVDYHANLDNPSGRGDDGLPVRRLSKVEKMLGIEDPPRRNTSLRNSSVPYDAYTSTKGYGGIDAYPGGEDKRGWRRSLSFFSRNAGSTGHG